MRTAAGSSGGAATGRGRTEWSHFDKVRVGEVVELRCKHCGASEKIDFSSGADRYNVRRQNLRLTGYRRSHKRQCTALKEFLAAVSEGEARRLELEEGPQDSPMDHEGGGDVPSPREVESLGARRCRESPSLETHNITCSLTPLHLSRSHPGVRMRRRDTPGGRAPRRRAAGGRADPVGVPPVLSTRPRWLTRSDLHRRGCCHSERRRSQLRCAGLQRPKVPSSAPPPAAPSPLSSTAPWTHTAAPRTAVVVE